MVNLDAGVREDDELGRYLQTVPLFCKLSLKERSKIAGALVLQTHNEGDHIVKQGDIGDGLYIIKQGKAKVVRESASGAAQELDIIEAGDYFGEGALLNDCPRGASVIAIERKLQVLFLAREHFQTLFRAGALKNTMFAKRKGTMESISSAPAFD